MSVSQRLDLRATQSLVMTPQLQQAIKLLQLSNQDLCSFVAQEIDHNPFLEYAEDGERSGPMAEPGAEVLLEDPGARALVREAQNAPPSEQEPTLQSNEDDSFTPQERSGGEYDPSAPQRSLAETVAERPSLRDHLLSQIHVDFTDPAERMIAAALVELLDEAGYLPSDLELARTQMGISAELLERVITRLHYLEPAGIFARSLKECLAIQLREKNRLDPAMQLLLDHLDLLAKREMAILMKLCHVDSDDLADMIAEIRALDPKPAVAFACDAAPPITPDVLLSPLPGGGWHIELNPETLPRVLVNESFYTRLNTGSPSGEDKAYVNDRWQQANWLVKALHQRATTILKVASEIVKKQDQFFVYGIQYLKPLVLRDIAEAIEMHESTVSRVTQNKYIATPRGLFELKYFFTTAIATTGGQETVSTLAVRQRIKELIEAEDPKAVLSDDKLAEILKREGIDIARRTVAKYREGLGIATSAQRRREKRNP
ncbi:MAG: RNA polymerase factor sigma-54 [Bdellovibrionales bacterium]